MTGAASLCLRGIVTRYKGRFDCVPVGVKGVIRRLIRGQIHDLQFWSRVLLLNGVSGSDHWYLSHASGTLGGMHESDKDGTAGVGDETAGAGVSGGVGREGA